MKIRYAVCTLLIALVAMSGAAVAGDNAPVFKQDRFAIGFWVDPPLDEASYKAVADANFTMVLGGFHAATPETVAQQLAFCRKHDLKAVVSMGGLAPENLPDAPECWGYMLRDEPSAKDFADLRAAADKVRAARPGKMVYVNLFPGYASPEALGTPTYDKHVSQFIKAYQPEVLSMDHYPQMKPDVDTRSKYCADLSVMRKHSLKAGIPFWNFFNVMPYGPHSDPTEGQLRWQTYTSIAYGAKGVLYFCYYTPAGGEFPKGGAIIARDGTPTRHYGEAQRINAELKNLGPTLMKMKSLGVRRITPKSDLAKVLSGTPIINIKRESYDPTNDYLLGLFKHEDGRWGVLINNYRHAFTAWPTVEFFCNSVWITEVDRTTGKEISVKDDSPDMEGIQLSLGAGEGRLFLLPPPKGGI